MKGWLRQKSGPARTGLTLVELLVALVVTGIVLSAVATLAYAMSRANEQAGQIGQAQAEVRYASLRVSRLIKQCLLVCATVNNGCDLAIWQADDNGNGQINVNELVYLECGGNGDYLRLRKFCSANNPVVALSDIKGMNVGSYSSRCTTLINLCSNAEFYLHGAAAPQTRRVTVSFDLMEGGGWRRYQTSATLRCRAGHLLDASGTAIVGDDD